MPAVLDAKSIPLSFSHPGKQKAYRFLVENPSMDFAAYRNMSGDSTLDEKAFEDVSRAIRVSGSDIVSDKKEPLKKINKKAKGAIMANETDTTAVPKKRGRPPGAKKVVAVEEKPKAKRGRPAKGEKKVVTAKSAKAKKAAKGIRYDAGRQQEIVSFILAQGRGGISKAKAKFGVSFPTLARWVKQAGSGKGSSKVERTSKKPGRPRKSETAPSGHVLISKKVMKEFQKGIAKLEAAFGAFSNALRVLE